MESKHEVIIVGAGPAGAITAVSLAQQGHEVLLVDRQQFPRDKTCGDAVPAGAIELMWRFGMREKIQQAVRRGEFYPVSGMLLVSPKGRRMEADFNKGKAGGNSYVAPRLYLDAIIQQHAVDSGAQFLQANVKEPIVEDGRVTGIRARVNDSIKEFHAQLVIGADGVTSAITRALRPKANQHIDKHRAVALRAYAKNIEEFPHQVEFYFYDEILPGYAWIFPTGDNQANVGLGMRLDRFRGDHGKGRLKNMLDDFLAMPEIKERLLPGFELRDVATWQLNFGSQKRLQHVYDGAILVGDAAGFINPLTGGGIHNAMVSADLAAQTAHNALQKGDVSRQSLKIYETQIHDAMWKNMRRSYTLQRSLLNFPFLIDMLIKWMGRNSNFAKTFLTKL
ncbi:MAG: NAD(P)/FAD-dependent oxidoreductase [Anaerolineae bacterium]